MSAIRRVPASRSPVQAFTGLAVVAAMLAAPSLYAAQLGHSRLVSQAGQPLHINIPVIELSSTEADTLQVEPAGATAWREAGLTPPVALDTLVIQLVPGPAGMGHVLQVSSTETFNQPVADLLLDVRSAAGEQRYQVSLLTQSDPAVVRTPVAAPSSSPVAGQGVAGVDAGTGASPASAAITVRPGDTMFAIARRHAVAGISEYQLMMALQQANPQAFIDDNVNLVRAGATLAMPDSAALRALSDRAARRLFHQHVVAFEQGRRVDADTSDEPQAIDTDADTDLMASEPAAPPEPADADADQQASDIDATTDVEPGATPAIVEPEPESAADEPASTPEPASSTPAQAAEPVAEPAATEAPADTSDAEDSPAAPAAAASGTQDQLRLSSTPPAARPNHPIDIAGVQAVQENAASGGLAVMSDANAAEPPATADDGDSTPHGSAADDDRVAESKAIVDAQERVSQLEENVKNLNRALQSQGEAAKDLVLDGANELRQSLSEVATAVSEATKGDEDKASADTSKSSAALVTDADPTEHVDSEDSLAQPDATTGRTPAPDVTVAEADTPVAEADASAPEGPLPDTPDPSSDASSGPDPAAASPDASSPSALSPAPAAIQSLEPQGLGGWLWKHIYLVLAAGLGLAVALMAWMFWLASRRQAGQASAITPEMVQEKLDQINLDLNPPAGGNGPGRT